jgi:hypothetical protein
VVVEGRALVLDSRKKDIEDFSPQVIIFSNGDLSSFEVALRVTAATDRRASTPTNRPIPLLLPGETEPTGPPVRTAAAR